MITFDYWSGEAAARSRRRWLRRFHILAATVLLSLVAYGVFRAIPNRTAIDSLQRGTTELRESHYQRAERHFAAVLPGEPNSLHARVGLACAFLREGHGSRALLELTLALERGLFPFALGDCGDGLSLDGRYFAAKNGAVGAFMAPRISSGTSIEELLLKTPSESEDEEARRFLLGACLAFRAGLDAAGWNYAANGAELGVPAHDIGLLPRCLGRGVLAHLHCPSVGPPDHPEAPLDCILNGSAGFAFQRQRPYLFPIDRPLAYFR